MLNSVLLHLDGAQPAQELIDFGVELAATCRARLRGLTLVDMRRLMQAASCEAAIGCCTEFRLLETVEQCQSRVRALLSAACAAAAVDFDIRREKGDPFEILPRQAQFHDLTISAVPLPGATVEHDRGLNVPEVLHLLSAGVQPLLVLRTPLAAINRVLLVSDGTTAANTAVREFLRHDLFPQAERRLFAIGDTEVRAKSLLRELTDYARQRRQKFECGWARGTARYAVLRYALKWESDLVVTGHRRQNPLLRPLWPQPAEQILRHTKMALFASG